jgi:phage-related protein
MTNKCIVLPKPDDPKDPSRIVAGTMFSIHALCFEERCEVRRFLNELDISRRRKMLQRLDRIAEHGLPNNQEQCRFVGEAVFEIKTDGVRLFAFQDGRRLIIVTHGMEKGTKKVQANAIARAQELRRQYYQEKKS